MVASRNADLVLEGGGVKGIALVGAISVLEEHGYRFPRVAGTSAGAIIGACVAAGLHAPAMRKIMEAVDYRRFKDEGLIDRFGPPGKGLSLLFEQGIFEGDYLRGWLGALLAEHGVETFADLALEEPELKLDEAIPELQRYRLVVMASDLSSGRLVRLPWHYRELYDREPSRQRVADAVRASMSIPFFYEPVRLVHGDQRVRALRDLHRGESWLVDGGLLSNFPVDVFDRPAAAGAPRWPTIGIKLSLRDRHGAPPHEVHSTIDLVKRMVQTMTGFYDQMHIDDPGTTARTIFVDTLGVRATDFEISPQTQRALYMSGRSAARQFLRAFDFDEYVAVHRTPGGTRALAGSAR